MAKKNMLEVQNAAKTMLANIRFASIDAPLQSIVITSAIPNEGKTTTTIELAKAIATAGNSVLLVEADMRHRSAASMMGVHSTNGAYAVMSGSISLQDAVVATGVPNLFFLDMEPNIPNPADLLSSRSYERFVDLICDNYDFVLFDTPPVGTFVDAAILSRLVDGVIMVVKIGGAKRDEILVAYDQLEKAEAHIIGACATFCEGGSSEYYYAYYNKKNERVNPDRETRKGSKENKKPLNSSDQIPSIPRGESKHAFSRQVPQRSNSAQQAANNQSRKAPVVHSDISHTKSRVGRTEERWRQ